MNLEPLNMVATGMCRTVSAADFALLQQLSGEALRSVLACLTERLAPNRASRQVSDGAERQIASATQIIDVMPGVGREASSLKDRLRRLGLGVVAQVGDADQCLVLNHTYRGTVDPALEDTLFSVAHELIDNAVRHGMYMRTIGRISINVAASSDGTMLEVADDGWGFGKAFEPGKGLRAVNALVMQHRGYLALRREAEQTIATFWAVGT